MNWISFTCRFVEFDEADALKKKRKKKKRSALYLIITSFPSATKANVHVLVNPLICFPQPLRFGSVFPLCAVYIMQ